MVNIVLSIYDNESKLCYSRTTFNDILECMRGLRKIIETRTPNKKNARLYSIDVVDFTDVILTDEELETMKDYSFIPGFDIAKEHFDEGVILAHWSYSPPNQDWLDYLQKC